MKLDELVAAQKRGEKRGVPSICSSHPWVLKAALHGDATVLIESTCNQVNQDGGYTGMTPDQFIACVNRIARENNFPLEKLAFGGDHLGPNPWKDEPVSSAMQKSAVLVSEYVKAGYTKIHIDCSMRLGDDPIGPLVPEFSAKRTAQLVKVAEGSSRGKGSNLCYIIGTEVPNPGGAQLDCEQLHITEVEDVQQTLNLTYQSFKDAGIESAWEKVIAVVVQPGVEFGDDYIIPYKRVLAKKLSRYIEGTPFIYEAHSTDHQSRKDLTHLVEDHFAILKVGPALTFAFREAIFTLATIEDELIPEASRSRLVHVIDDVMVRNPKYWRSYYIGTENELSFARKYSLSDRIRYYWNNPEVQAAINKLLENLNNISIPNSLLHQYDLTQSRRVLTGNLALAPEQIIFNRIIAVLDNYKAACSQ
jgi:D-tagatose-1,6-bisphosphate aldolase subunit GatZ/KbaZ